MAWELDRCYRQNRIENETILSIYNTLSFLILNQTSQCEDVFQNSYEIAENLRWNYFNKKFGNLGSAMVSQELEKDTTTYVDNMITLDSVIVYRLKVLYEAWQFVTTLESSDIFMQKVSQW